MLPTEKAFFKSLFVPGNFSWDGKELFFCRELGGGFLLMLSVFWGSNSELQWKPCVLLTWGLYGVSHVTLSKLIEMCALGMQVYAFLTVHKVVIKNNKIESL